VLPSTRLNVEIMVVCCKKCMEHEYTVRTKDRVFFIELGVVYSHHGVLAGLVSIFTLISAAHLIGNHVQH
jgi:hypothetical protein